MRTRISAIILASVFLQLARYLPTIASRYSLAIPQVRNFTRQPDIFLMAQATPAQKTMA